MFILLDSTLTYFISHYMETVTAATPGYRLKTQFKHLLPPVLGRPDNYYLTPFCLPPYDPIYKLAMHKMSLVKCDDRAYFGAFNDTLLTE